MSRPNIPSKSVKKGCALCGKPIAPAFTPFCGSGCRDRDLLQWLGEGYRVPGARADDDDREIDDDDREIDGDGLDSEPRPPL